MMRAIPVKWFCFWPVVYNYFPCSYKCRLRNDDVSGFYDVDAVSGNDDDADLVVADP